MNTRFITVNEINGIADYKYNFISRRGAELQRVRGSIFDVSISSFN